MDIGTAFASLRLALDALKGASDTVTKATVEDAVAKAQGALLEAQGIALRLQSDAVENLKLQATMNDEIEMLKKQLSDINDWKKMAACYKLDSAMAGSMTWVRVFDPVKGRENGFEEPMHFACPSCFEKQKRSILTTEYEGTNEVKCPTCKYQVQFRPYQKVQNTFHSDHANDSFM